MRALELFGGSGGLAEGFARAGLRFELAIDCEGAACESYRRNVGTEAVQMDVGGLLALARCGWRAGELDLLVADLPPARRAPSANGDLLCVESELLAVTCDLVRQLRPRAYLIAQSPGLEDGVQRVQGTIGALNDVGYCVLDVAVLDAADFGVPQRRRRSFWFGASRWCLHPLAACDARGSGGAAERAAGHRDTPAVGELSRGARAPTCKRSRPCGAQPSDEQSRRLRSARRGR